VRSVDGIIAARRHHRLRLDDVARLCASAKKVRPFIVADDWTPGASLDDQNLKMKLTPQPAQLSLF
jgi:predicted DNA-binding helix-hairpin-helix protein